MEELSARLKLLYVISIMLSCLSLYGQEQLMIYSVKGEPEIQQDINGVKKAAKGFVLSSKDVAILKPSDTLLIISNDGKGYQLTKAGSYAYKDVFKNEIKYESSSFTSKFFSYVWDEFSNNRKQKAKIGVVYRNDRLVIIEPLDASKLFTSEIRFEWESEFEENYFHLKNMENNHVTKIRLKGNSLSLFVDNNLLKRGVTYQWAISKEKFPDLNQIQFYTFSLVTTKEFNELKTDLAEFKTEMKRLGFNDNEIKLSLCNDYKLCF